MRLMSGTVIVQIIAFASAPLMTRLFTPEAFGVAALFIAVLTICNTFATFRYDMAIVLPETDEDGFNLVCLSALCLTLVVSIVTVLVFSVDEAVLAKVKLTGMKPYLWVLPIGIFFSGAGMILNGWNSRLNEFARQSISNVSGRLVSTVGGILAGLIGLTCGGILIAVNVGYSFFVFLVLVFLSFSSVFGRHVPQVSWAKIKSLASRYRKFPLVTSWSSLLSAVSIGLPAFVLTAYFSTAVAGLYALSYRMIVLPLQMVGGAISGVFLRKAAEARHSGGLTQLTNKTFRNLVLIAAFPFVVIGLFGPELFALVFGESWREAGAYSQILCPWIFFIFIGGPLMSLSVVLECQGLALIFNIIFVVSRVISLVSGGILGDPKVALMLYSFSGVLVWFFFLAFLMKRAGSNWVVMLRYILSDGIVSLLCLVPVLLSFLYWSENVFLLLGGCGLGALFYSAYVWRSSPEVQQAVSQSIQRVAGVRKSAKGAL